MILIEGLTKTYRLKKRRACVALSGIDLCLPDTGMIFIIGKSGSGKSTLLNMIGGLDGFDGGRIVSDGNDLSRFRAEDFYKYRASYAGFVFQDYHLLDELTVAENVTLEAQIAAVADINVGATLARVDLSGYEERFPDELSGGQKQRVAIARALVKSPRVLLCDEPTGNLDKNTSRQILEMLKSISRERLVLIVSHNLPDAEKYGDRIIELSEGKVISDRTRRFGYSDELSLCDGVLTLPYNRRLDEAECKQLSRDIRLGRVRHVVQNDMGYDESRVTPRRGRKVLLRSRPLRLHTAFFLFRSLGRVGRVRTAVTACLCALMIVLLALFQSYLSYDTDLAIQQSLPASSGGTVVLKKDSLRDGYGGLDTSSVMAVTDEDLQAIRVHAGRGVKQYLLYNYCCPVNLKKFSAETEKGQQYSYEFARKTVYSPQMPGVLACDEGYLLRRYAQDGKLIVLAGDIEQSRDSSAIILTDYLADAMLYYNPSRFLSYEDIIGNIDNRCTVAAILDTGYKTRYGELIERVEGSLGGNEALATEQGLDFLDEIKNHLSIGYSINPNFYDAAVMENSKNYARLADFELVYDNRPLGQIRLEEGLTDELVRIGSDVPEGEIQLSEGLINQLLKLSSGGVLHMSADITLHCYEGSAQGADATPRATFTYKMNASEAPSVTLLSEKDFLQLKAFGITPFAVYLEDYEGIGDTIDAMQEYSFSWSFTKAQTVNTLNQSVATFFDLFRLIEVAILALTAVFLISHSVRAVRSHHYQIGVIKALGGRGMDIARIYLAKNLLLTLTIGVLSYLGSIRFVGLSNEVLERSFLELADISLGGIEIISFYPALVITVVLVAMAVSLIATAVPLLLLRRIKPMNIIKAKE